VLNDARELPRRRADVERGQSRPLAAPVPDLEALQPVLAGTLPLVLLADRQSDILAAVDLAAEYSLRLIIGGGAEAWRVADRLAAARVPVVLAPLTNIPSYDALGARYDNAARLHQAGVRIAFITAADATHNARLVKQDAGNAVSYGLPWDAALRAVTLTPAEIYGLGATYGSLEPGKVANVVVWSGDPFEFATAVEHVFIRGRAIPLASRQTELLERYRTLPPDY
jgi:imidazolonepropionase-like amidohydrolase